MTPENFVYWLQGWFELNDTIDHREGATPETLQVIRDHLNLVMDKQTPDRKKDLFDLSEKELNEGYKPEKIDMDKITTAMADKLYSWNKNQIIETHARRWVAKPPRYPHKDHTGTPTWPTVPTIICSNMSQETFKKEYECNFSPDFKVTQLSKDQADKIRSTPAKNWKISPSFKSDLTIYC